MSARTAPGAFEDGVHQARSFGSITECLHGLFALDGARHRPYVPRGVMGERSNPRMVLNCCKL